MSKSTISFVSVIRARHGDKCTNPDCKKELRAGKPAVKIGKDILCFGCAEKRGYRNLRISFEVEPDYIFIGGMSVAAVCKDCNQEIPVGAACFYRRDGEDKGTYSCEKCGVNNRKYVRPVRSQKQKKDSLKANK